MTVAFKFGPGRHSWQAGRGTASPSRSRCHGCQVCTMCAAFASGAVGVAYGPVRVAFGAVGVAFGAVGVAVRVAFGAVRVA